MHLRNYFTLIILCFTFQLFSQERIKVIDSITQEGIPFVKIMSNLGTPGFTDIDGYYMLEDSVSSLELRFQGYHDLTINRSDIQNKIILLHPVEQYIKEVTVMPGENPAHRIIKAATANRKLNHPLENDAFTYDSYSKFVFDVNEELRKKILDSVPKKEDSSFIGAKKFIENQYFFLIESASKRRFIPPYKDREDIVAYKVSGLNMPIFSSFAQSLQSFHFYDNQVEIGGTSYPNPIAFGSTKRYLFILEDTTVVNQDTTFTIYFRPRSNKNFEGMEGYLYINTDRYALEKINVHPYKSKEDTVSNTDMKIVQEYERTKEGKWFPSKLSSQIYLYGAQLVAGDDNGYIVGTGNTYIKNIKINPEDMNKRGFGGVVLATEPGADAVDSLDWNALRGDTLTSKEYNTYAVIDSMAKEANLDRVATGLNALMTGKVRIDKVNVLLDKLLGFNLYEGFRLGLGLETSDRVFKHMTIGGYFGYGFTDKAWKYGGYYTAYLNRRMGVELTLSYKEDVFQRGGYKFEKNGLLFSGSEDLAFVYIRHMDWERKASLQFKFRPRGNMNLVIEPAYRRIFFNEFYSYQSDRLGHVSNRIDVAEVKFEYHYSPGQKVRLLGDLPFGDQTKFPVLKLALTKGFAGIAESKLDYFRINAQITQSFPLFRLGEFEYKIQFDQTIGDVPLFAKNVFTGTREDWGVSVENAFETVLPGRFYHDWQTALFTRYNFPKIRTKAKWNEPQFVLHHAIGYGEMKEKDRNNMYLQTMDNVYSEAGLLIDNLYVSGFSGIGLGVFYNYGAYGQVDWQKNVVPKITLNVVF